MAFKLLYTIQLQYGSIKEEIATISVIIDNILVY